jgi:hypothetical protein
MKIIGCDFHPSYQQIAVLDHSVLRSLLGRGDLLTWKPVFRWERNWPKVWRRFGKFKPNLIESPRLRTHMNHSGSPNSRRHGTPELQLVPE